jgi:hypothetical protein
MWVCGCARAGAHCAFACAFERFITCAHTHVLTPRGVSTSKQAEWRELKVRGAGRLPCSFALLKNEQGNSKATPRQDDMALMIQNRAM